MDARWPEGRWLFALFATRFGAPDPETIGLIHGIVDLFFPSQRKATAPATTAAKSVG